jgi:hypothetical protein
MSSFIDLGIDCGDCEGLADQISAHFDRFIIRLPEGHPVECDAARKVQKLSHWFVDVYPLGMGYGVPNGRPELVEKENYAVVRQALYEHLSLGTGYRRALFGSEIFDFFTSSSPEELAVIDLPDMIYSTAAFPIPPSGVKVIPFCPGYLRVVAID